MASRPRLLTVLFVLAALSKQALGEEVRIGAAKIRKFLVVPGKITVDPDKSAHVSPRYEGIVTKVFVSSGDEVSKSTPLAVIERNVGISSYVLKSPINGFVLDRHVNSGDPVKEDHDAFQVSDLSNVWATLHVKENELPHFKVGKNVAIKDRSNGAKVVGGIHFVSPIVDPRTRTAHVAVSIPNEGRRWLPGKIIDGYLFQEERNVPIAIPTHAIKKELGRAYTYREQGNQFIKTYLRLGIQDANYAEVLRGLDKGITVTSSPKAHHSLRGHGEHKDTTERNSHDETKHEHDDHENPDQTDHRDHGSHQHEHEHDDHNHGEQDH